MWNEFVSYIDKNIGSDQRECLVAWNGESWDMKWICKLTQAPGSKLAMPKGIKYFIDPLHAFQNIRIWSSVCTQCQSFFVINDSSAALPNSI